MGFYYFLPGVRDAGFEAAKELPRFGLEYIVDNPTELVHRGVSAGVGGMPGVICGSSRNFDHMSLKFTHDIQWEPCAKEHVPLGSRDVPQAWVGFKELPGPEELMRGKLLPGEVLTDEDGRKWMIPIAYEMRPDGSSVTLPTVCEWDDETQMMLPTKVRRRYQELWSFVWNGLNELFERWEAGNDQFEFVIPDGQQMVMSALQANYRVGWREISLLEVFTDDIVSKVWDILIDQSAFRQKKSVEDLLTGNT